MSSLGTTASTSLFPNEIPKWGEPYPNILDRKSVLECFKDYILEVNYREYKPDKRKVLAVRSSDRTASLRNFSAPIRKEVYYFIEGEIFPHEGRTRLDEEQTPDELAETLLDDVYEQLYIWVAYDFTKGSPPGFRKPFEGSLLIKGSGNPNPEEKTRGGRVIKGVDPEFFIPDPVPLNKVDENFAADVPTEEIESFVDELVQNDFRNAFPEWENNKIWQSPLVGIAQADDPLFARFQDPEVVGSGHRFPEEWLHGAKSIISVFLPFTSHVTDNYLPKQRYSALEFSSGKWNGSKFLNVVRRALIRFAERRGGAGLAPNIDPRYDSDGWKPFWSERHVAFAAGLGTFGLHQNFITEKGALGRLCSVITTLKLKPTRRKYTDVYGYCLYGFDGSCLACVKRCPTGAVTPAGKLIRKCETHGNKEHFRDWNYGSCGHCSTLLPCSRKIPSKILKAMEKL